MNATPPPDQRKQTDAHDRRKAIRLIIVATLAFSPSSLIVGLSNSNSNPVLSNALIVGAETIMFLILLQNFLRHADKKYGTRRQIVEFVREYWRPSPNTKKGETINLFQKMYNIWNQYALIAVIIGSPWYLFFAWSINFLDIAIASIISQLWLIIFVLVRYVDKIITKEEVNLNKFLWVLFGFALIGIIYVTLSHTSISQPFSYKGLLLLGVGLVLIGTRAERSIKWAELMAKKWLGPEERPEKKLKEEELKKLFILLCLIIAGMFTIILTLLGSVIWILQGNVWNLTFTINSVSLFTHEIVITNMIAWIICIAGGFLDAIGRWNFRLGNISTDTLDVNGIYYLTPVLSLVLLLPFGLIQLQRWDYFIVGALIILATSILISIEDRTGRRGFIGLIVSLWSTGLLIYFREKWIQWPWLANKTRWEWDIESVDYYSLIVLSATIFILILSFRISRLIERTNSEEDQYFRMKHIVKNLKYYHKNSLYEYLKELDKFDYKTIGNTLENFENQIEEIRANILPNHTDIKNLSDLELEFELLHRSKQRGRYSVENLVLYIFALVTIMVAIGTRPIVTSPWNALMIDVLAFLFSSAICFMTIHLIDLKAYRGRSTEELKRDKEAYKKEAINQRAVEVISIILAVVISMSYVVLLYGKWMAWFL